MNIFYFLCVQASNSCNTERRNTFADREARVSLLKSEKDRAEKSKAVGNLRRITCGILGNLNHLEKNRNASFFHLLHLGSKHVTELQAVSDNCNSETLRIKELFISPELQFTVASGITDNADITEVSKDSKSNCTDSFSMYQRMWQTSEVNDQSYRNKASFPNQVSVTSNSDQRSEENFCACPSLGQSSPISCASVLGKPVTVKTQRMTLKDKPHYLQMKFSDLNTFQEDGEGRNCIKECLQVKTLESEFENEHSEYSGQVDPVEYLIQQLRRELAFLRSQVRLLYNMCVLTCCSYLGDKFKYRRYVSLISSLFKSMQ